MQFENSWFVGRMSSTLTLVNAVNESGTNSMREGAMSAHVTGCTSTPYTVAALAAELIVRR